MKYIVPDGVRKLEVFGEKIAESSSHSPGKSRWVEFHLYKTENNLYVASRIGQSLVYHTRDCKNTKRNRLSAEDSGLLTQYAVPCELCNPSATDLEIYPEVTRALASVCHSASGVVSFAVKTDQDGIEYFTAVARKFLEQASVVDADIRKEFYTDQVR